MGKESKRRMPNESGYRIKYVLQKILVKYLVGRLDDVKKDNVRLKAKVKELEKK